MELENWPHSAAHFKTIEGEEESSYPIHAYRDSRKSELAVGAGVLNFLNCNIIKTMQYRLNGLCSNSQEEQMTTQKALEYIQNMQSDENIVVVSTDSKITLQLIKNDKEHTKFIEQIRTKVQEKEKRGWSLEFRCIKAHAGYRVKEFAVQNAKEGARNKNIEECYKKKQRML